MNNIKSKFSIKDLENLSGIKAHTIRIWEKRYNLFQPNRTETNIRYYSLSSLQKILNISFLNKNGYKISKIASLKPDEITSLVKEIAEINGKHNHYVNELKIAMINFDQNQFFTIYNKLTNEFSFSDIFYNIFVPLLEEIGILWQTDTITPAHEHFIVELIKQRIIANTDKLLNTSTVSKKSKVYVLFLPNNEVHELGLLFTNHELINKGKQSIYLGQSVPVESLQFLTSKYDEIIFISSFTVYPDKDHLKTYLTDFESKLLKGSKNKLIISGRMTAFIEKNDNPNIKIFKTSEDVLKNI